MDTWTRIAAVGGCVIAVFSLVRSILSKNLHQKKWSEEFEQFASNNTNFSDSECKHPKIEAMAGRLDKFEFRAKALFLWGLTSLIVGLFGLWIAASPGDSRLVINLSGLLATMLGLRLLRSNICQSRIAKRWQKILDQAGQTDLFSPF
ncbi:MAG TPA: hypothetical protein VFQ60_04315 [Patescibacteria group bacterium]|nr:hypothetical protein [Patescibacteria group bacterium]